MKIVFVNPNRYAGYAKPPLGLLSVATVCKKTGHSVKILDADLLNLTPYGVAHYAQGADLVGITAMTPLIGEAIAIAKAVKSGSQIPVIIGGVHATIFPQELTKAFDAVVCGEGEGSVLNLLADLKGGKLKDIYYADHSVDYNSLPLPDYSLLDLSAYHPRHPHAAREPWTTVSTSRGCPFACTFCSQAVFGRQYRALSAKRTADLLKMLVKTHGVCDITFYDDEFTIDSWRVYDLCDHIQDLDLTWTCEARADLVSKSILRTMRQAGCRLIYFGIESGNQEVLDGLNKHIRLEQVELAVRQTQEAGIKAAGYFMLGCPGETPQTMQETIDFATGLHLDHAQFSACSPLPGSRLYDQYVKDQIPDWSAFQYLSPSPKFLLTNNGLTADDIETAVERANSYWRRE